MRISEIQDPRTFQRLCQLLFSAEYEDFQQIDDSGGDRGNDGYVRSQEKLFAIYCPEKRPTPAKYFKKKIGADLKKANQLRNELGYRIKQWIFVTPAPLSEEIHRYLQERAAKYGFDGFSWAENRLKHLFEKHKHLQKRFPQLQVVDLKKTIWESHDRLALRFAATEEYKQKYEDAKHQAYETRIDVAKQQLEKGLFKRAKAEYERIIQDLKTDPEVTEPRLLFRSYTNLAACELERGELPSAIRHFKEAFSFQPQDQKALSNLALAQTLEGNLEDAERTVEKALGNNEKDEHAIRVKAQILLKTGRRDQLLEFLSQKSGEADQLYFTGVQAMETGDFDTAEKRFRELVQREPDNLKFLTFAAEATFLARQQYLREAKVLPWQIPPMVLDAINDAEQFLTKAIDLEKQREAPERLAMSHVNRSVIRLTLGRSEEALADCISALENDPKQELAFLNKGRAELQLNSFDRAIESLKIYMQLGGEHYLEAVRVLALAFLQAGRTEDARDLALKELENGTTEDNLELVEIAVDALDRNQEFDKANQLTDSTSRDFPDNGQALRIQARHFRNTGREVEAERLLREALPLSSGFAKYLAVSDLVDLLYQNKKWEQAANLLRPYVNKDENNFVSRRYLDCLYRQGNFSEALALIDRLKKPNEIDEVVSQIEAAIHVSLGNLRKGSKLLLQVYQRLPERTDLLVEYGICLFRLGEGEKAVKTFDQVKKKIHRAQDFVALAQGYHGVGASQEALELAYKALKKFPNDPRVHFSYVMLFLQREQTGESVPPKHFIKAFQDTIDKFNERFPEEKGLEKVAIDPELKSIKERLDQLGEFTLGIQKQYQQGLLPLGSISRLTGRSCFDVWAAFSGTKEVGIRSALGNTQEQNHEREAISEATGIVVDPFALFTLAQAERLELISESFERIIIHQSVLDEIIDTIARNQISSGKGHMVIGKQGDQYVRDEVTAEEIERRVRFLERLRRFITEACEVTGFVRQLTQAEKGFMKIFGEPSGSSVILALQLDIPIFSDDALLRALARKEKAVKSFCSQTFFTYQKDQGLLEGAQFFESILQLLKLRYFYISTNADLIEYCVNKNGYQSNWELELVLDEIGRGETSLESLARVLGDFLHRLWITQVPDMTKSLLLQKVLSTATRNHPMPQIIPTLLQYLRAKMSRLLHHYFLEIQEQIRQWVAHNKSVIS